MLNRALIFAMGDRPTLAPLERYRPSPLLHIADKPILFHCIEKLEHLGIKKIDLVLNHFPEQIEKALGNGERFGVSITYHLAKDRNDPFHSLKPLLESLQDSLLLIGSGDSISQMGALDREALWMENKVWTGWGVLKGSTIGSIETFDALKCIGLSEQECPLLYSTRSIHDFFEANIRFLNLGTQELAAPSDCREIEPGIFISRGVSLDPSSTLAPPVFLGRFCQIEKGCTIGPFAMIENNCLINQKSTIENSVILQKSFVGEGLHIDQCIVDRNLLINKAEGSSIEIEDDFILGEIPKNSLSKTLFNGIERALAFVLLLLTSPLYLIWNVKEEEKVLLPVKGRVKTFNLRLFHTSSSLKSIASIWNIVKGETHFIGLKPRSVKEYERLAPDWKKLYSEAKTGLITLSDLQTPQDSSTLYAQEAYYAIHQGVWFDCKLFIKWLFTAKEPDSSSGFAAPSPDTRRNRL